jgi:hypothetical protein
LRNIQKNISIIKRPSLSQALAVRKQSLVFRTGHHDSESELLVVEVASGKLPAVLPQERPVAVPLPVLPEPLEVVAVGVEDLAEAAELVLQESALQPIFLPHYAI